MLKFHSNKQAFFIIIFIIIFCFDALTNVVNAKSNSLLSSFSAYSLTDEDENIPDNDTIFDNDILNTPTNPLIPDDIYGDSDPPGITTEIHYDPESNQYYVIRKAGDRIIGRPYYIGFDEFVKYDLDRALQNHWKQKAQPHSFERGDGIIPQIHIGSEVFDRIFGGGTIDIRPTGSAELIFGVLSNHRDDPAIDEKRRTVTNFDFQPKIQLSVQAQVGEKIEINSTYSTEATFDFENKMKVEYRGTEDEILQLVEAGDVTLPLPGTLIQGSQGLFGFKTQMRFGNTTVTSIFSQQKTESQSIEVTGGAQMSEFMIKADEYEENRHFFIGQYFRDNYDESLSSLPIVRSPVNITRIEVWVTNVGAAVEDNRNIVAFADLGEAKPYNENIGGSHSAAPSNYSNDLYNMMHNEPSIRNISQVNSFLSQHHAGFSSGTDYENIENARRLRSNEFTYNSKLGFISLNQSINPDQVLAVAYQYTIIGDTTVYQVGEFSNEVDAPNSIIVKLLKSTAVNTRIPMWDLMMKNVYSIGAFQVNRDEFRLNILYDSEEYGVPIGFLDEGPVEGQPLIRVMNLDNLNTQLDPIPDGVFDFIDNAATQGGTIQASNGRIYFPVVEPFGSHLRKKLEDPDLGDKYAFDSLYTTTKERARQFPERNRFYLEGRYKSASGSEISLNAINVPQGSVVVTAGGVPLTENVDYTVDYTLGRVQIINEGILNSGTPIRISLESSTFFDIQTKTLLGTHVDHRISDNFNIGATIMRLSERPLTQKVNYGDEPIANTIWGLNTTYSTESLFITRALDFLPFYSTTAPSNITFNGEFAHLIPGHSRHIGDAGTAYIDDFEGSKSSIDLKNVQSWFLASTPQHQTDFGMFPEGAPGTELAFRFNVARLAWYIIDPLFTRNNNLTPTHIRNDINQQSNHYVREVMETEIWPNKENPSGYPGPIPIFNMAYYPAERGPYNYDTAPSAYSQGIAQDGRLIDPETRWGGIMRGLTITDFEAANVEYIEFWMLDPFIYDEEHSGGDLYFNLGDVSEDALRDGRKSFENGLPISEVVVDVDTTIWGRVPSIQAVVDAFDNNPESRQYQDVGLDGLSTEDERDFFRDQFLDQIEMLYGAQSQAYEKAWEDPSADNYRYFRGTEWDQEEASVLERYKYYNLPEGNSPTADMSPEPYPTQATNIPNTEDINRDGTLNESERYFQYRVSLRPEDMEIGSNYITDIVESTVRLKNEETETVKWYQFKIPLRDPNRQAVNNIQDFTSIRFMRVFFKNFEEPIVCRFATFELVRGQWRIYDRNLTSPGEYTPDDPTQTAFEVFTVNIEENGTRYPVPYVIPPGIEREVDMGHTTMHQRNEQSLAMRLKDLKDGDARAVYKTMDMDIRQYKRLKMFAHAEAVDDEFSLEDDDVTVFIRLGTDFTNNYYEYEVPMKLTPWGTSAVNERLIWPLENEFDIQLDKLTDLKLERNTLARDPHSGVLINRPFSKPDGDNKMTVVGTPTLSSVKVIMIGVRNPKQSLENTHDDGLPKSVEVWVNELRLYDFDNEGGWAATGRVNARLADLGNMTLSGMVSTAGFGSIEQKVNERSQEDIKSYDLSTNLQLGRFFPENWGLNIPMHFSYAELFSNPKYNPLNPDILFDDDLASLETQEERDELIKNAQDYQRRRSINFTNVSRSSSGSSPHRFYSLENFDFTYAYNEVFYRNIDYEYDRQAQYLGAIGYNYMTTPDNVRPFSNIGFLSHSAFRLIRDFNFNYQPSLVSIRNEINRGYAESLMRDKSAGMIILEPNYIKTFDWRRLYNVRYDLTQALRIEYNATNQARIDEPPGSINPNDDDYQHKRDSILQSFKSFGRTTMFNQRLSANYNIPVNKLPLLDWVNANAAYTADYDWYGAPLAAAELGNTIQNAQNIRFNLSGNLVNLYNKIDYLQTINQKGQSRGRQQQQRPQRPPQGRGEEDEEEDDDDTNYAKEVFDGFLRILMSVRNISVTFNETNGIRMPGFMHEPQYFGQNFDVGAPGLPFVFGSQEDIKEQAAREGWITTDPDLNTAFTRSHNNTINARALVEPVPNLKIDLTALRNYSQSHTEYFVYNDSLGTFDSHNPMQSGNFSISFFAFRTTFETVDDRDYSSQNFENFKDYRYDIAFRLAEENPNWNQVVSDTTGFPEGYGPTSQDVLIPAFMAAYAGWDPSSSTLSPFMNIPMPNWRLTYDGLTRIDFLNNYFSNIIITHGYTSTFSIGQYTSDIRYREVDGYQAAMEVSSGNFIPEYEIGQVAIQEQFNPLINIDMTWENSLITKFEYRRRRDIGLSFANNQITDLSSSELIIGTGYRFQDVSFTVSQVGGSGTQQLQSDLVTRLNLSFRDSKTILRKLNEDQDIISSGQHTISINFSVDYQLSARVNFRLFFDRVVNTPYISNQFKNSNTHGGFSLRFMLI